MLYVVATPIGNVDDITLRAIKNLFSVDFIASENPSKTKLFLIELQKRYPNLTENKKIPPFIHINEYLEEFKIPEIISYLKDNKTVSLVSEAGTPQISDPGLKIVQVVAKLGIPISPIPGVSSLTSALSISHFPTNTVIFIGFLPKKKAKKEKKLKQLKHSIASLVESKFYPTIVLFESPHRLIDSLNYLLEVFGDIEIVCLREATKKFEEIIRCTIQELIDKYAKIGPKGEYTLILFIQRE